MGVWGYGEGGLIAFYAAALDNRIDAAVVSGYFDSRQQVWQEPLYRNVFGLLQEFGDAEIASLIAPRKLIVEYSPVPKVDGPSAPRAGRHETAAPGKLRTPEASSVSAEVKRARDLTPSDGAFSDWITLTTAPNANPIGPGSQEATRGLLSALSVPARVMPGRDSLLPDARRNFQRSNRQHRQLQELVAYNQKLCHLSQGCIGQDSVSDQFWKRAKPASADKWSAETQFYRDYYRDEIVGSFATQKRPADPRSRKAFEGSRWVAYEVQLSVLPDVFAWGYLAVPKNLQPGERRPVVVCQHGVEGLPADTFNDDPSSKTFADAAYEHAFAARLADQGFIVLASHFCYRGGNEFRQLQRRANPLKKTLWGITIAQHQQLLDWLGTLPFVDARRMAFYGISYGGATAMYVPPLVEKYAAVICSAFH